MKKETDNQTLKIPYGYFRIVEEVKPGDGWEIVPKGKMVEFGDQSMQPCGDWFSATASEIGKPAGSEPSHIAFRRKKKCPCCGRFLLTDTSPF